MNPNLCELELPPCQGDLPSAQLVLIDGSYHDNAGIHAGQVLCCRQCADRLQYEDEFIRNGILSLTHD